MHILLKEIKEFIVLKIIMAPLLALAALGAQAADAAHSAAPAHLSASAAALPPAVALAPAVQGGITPAPMRMGKARPQLGSGVAFAPDGRLWLVGVNAQGGLFVQRAVLGVAQTTVQGATPGAVPSAAPDDLAQWEAPRVLDIQGDPISADSENRPKLAFGPAGQVVISYTQPLAKPNTGQIRMLRSIDGGQTFSAPLTVHTDRQEITHRFESITFDAQGTLHTVWIDKRDLERAPKVGKKSTYRGAAIYRNVSLDGGATFGPDLRVADHSCECCRIALAVGADGRAHALWRHVFDPDVRDHAFATFDASATSAAPSAVPVRATFDDWHINGCPHHGPALAASAQGGFHTVWFGVRKQGELDVAAVRYARLNADGTPQPGSERPLPDARAEHADVLAAGQQVAVVWRSVDGARSSAKAWLSSDGGRSFREQLLGEVSGPNDFPRLAQHAGRMVVVWRNPQEVLTYALTF